MTNRTLLSVDIYDALGKPAGAGGIKIERTGDGIIIRMDDTANLVALEFSSKEVSELMRQANLT